jgi:hypothetical protein
MFAVRDESAGGGRLAGCHGYLDMSAALCGVGFCEIWKFECESEMLLSSPFSQKCVFVRARARAPFFVSSHPLLSAPVVQGGSRLFKAAVVIAA